MNLEQWQQLQLEVSPEDINLGLTDIKAVAKRLKLDKIKPKLVTVAGTNGKVQQLPCWHKFLHN